MRGPALAPRAFPFWKGFPCLVLVLPGWAAHILVQN